MAASVSPLRYCIYIQIICSIFVFSWVAGQQLRFQSEDISNLFEEFVIKYNRSYGSNKTEYAKRFNNFKHNIQKAEILNRDYAGMSPVHGINKFSDMSSEEFHDVYLSGYRPKISQHFGSFSSEFKSTPMNTTGLPKKVDWRAKGVVSKIKNQRTCGACWAFTVAEVMESMLSIQYGGKMKTLSVQELIDCDSLEYGCKGGDICSATRWASLYGIVEEKYYHLKDKTGTCRPIPDIVPRIQVHSYACNRYVNKERGILSLLTRGPVAVAVDAKTWHSYTQGIIQFHCPSFINHAVVLVGYDLTGDVPYYIARNSWGTDFGDDGYIYIKVGDNLCGLALEVVFLTVDLPR